MMRALPSLALAVAVIFSLLPREVRAQGDAENPLRLSPGFVVLHGLVLDDADVSRSSAAELRLLRNSVFARHGWQFVDPELQAHFSSQSWYQPKRSFSEKDLTPEDHKNIALLQRHEALLAPRPAVAAQVEQLQQAASALEVLDAYLTDKDAVERGNAPDGFVQPPLDAYKTKGITRPLTAPPKGD